MGRRPGRALPWASRGAGRIGLHFEEEIELHERTPDGFETARTRLARGARARRTRRRVKARGQRRAALETFDRHGAQPWADQAAAELAPTGETARRRDVEHT